ncbi:HTH-type transcriptional activator IlvY [Marinomonas sp. 15G1-11]|uniref:HTH-type transcriptional activator IlvY n=1 Tax=Marinomonas phaeophyticola TaxID=3004091 RepID=A0ABT4JTR2_9GAMM|nr:HTH-type transcriptional activator IlvY [Marinomonas sp. 15G1-11]MCZ2721747.1 HTH-type transcriptional activator IlvY [Marinomonas sp. 15G1-11]
MDIKTLKIFLHLSESLHFSRTSDAFHISPSTLSRHIKQLEESLGCCLLTRDNRSVSLTREGQIFQTYCRESLAHWHVLKQSLDEQNTQLTGEISLYCSVTASYSFLYDILSQFRRLHPKIEMKLHTGDPAPALSRVIEKYEDIAIAARPPHVPNNLAFKRIAISPLVFISPNDALTSNQLGVSNKQALQWDKIPMILSEEGLARSRSDQWFKQQGIKPNVYAQVSGNEAIVSMVSLGFGVGVVPKIVLDNSPLASKITILDIQPELEAFDVGFFTLKKSLSNPIVSAFWEQIGVR